MKLRHIIILTLFVLINGIILYSIFRPKGEAEDPKKDENFVTFLEATEVENMIEQLNVSGYGTVTSYNSLDVSSEVQGKLQAGINMKPGVHFKKGQLLFSIDDKEAQYALRARKSAFINSLANILPDIKIDFSSEYSKWEDYINSIKLNKNLPTLPTWKTEKEKIFLSTRNILSEYFTIKSQEEQLKKYSVFAPFSGMTTDIYINDFSVVNPGSKVMKIVQTGNYEISVTVPVSHIDEIKVGTKCNISTTEGKEKGIGTVVRISDVINRNTQSIAVYVKPEANAGERFIEGEYVQVKINTSGEFKGVRIPSNAIFNDQVFIYSTKDSTLSLQPVISIDENESGVFVTGLKNKSIVIIQDVLNFTDTTKYAVLIK